MRAVLGLMFCACVLAGCAGAGGLMYRPVDDVAELEVTLADASWNGAAIPRSGICSEGFGEGMSPAILVERIPSGADAVVVEFNDTGRHDLAEYGGHGALWMSTGGAAELVIPSVQERTFDLPEGVHMEHGHRAQGFGPGACLAPCSLGRGHLYVARVMAVQRNAPEGPRLLAEAPLPLGLY